MGEKWEFSLPKSCNDKGAQGEINMKKEKTAAETKEYLKEGIESGRIVEGSFMEDAIKFDIEYLEEKEKEEDK